MRTLKVICCYANATKIVAAHIPVQFLPPSIPSLTAPRPVGAGYTPQAALPPQQPIQIPGTDVFVAVAGSLPLQAKVEDLTRLLGVRQRTRSVTRLAYPTTMFELITLVERNPEKPRGKDWNSIPALSMRFDAVTGRVSVEYCVEDCGHDPRTGAFHPRRRMAYYHAAEADVIKKADKKLGSLKKYAAPGPPP